MRVLIIFNPQGDEILNENKDKQLKLIVFLFS